MRPVYNTWAEFVLLSAGCFCAVPVRPVYYIWAEFVLLSVGCFCAVCPVRPVYYIWAEFGLVTLEGPALLKHIQTISSFLAVGREGEREGRAPEYSNNGTNCVCLGPLQP